MRHTKPVTLAKANTKGDGEVEIELFSVFVALLASFFLKNPETIPGN